MEKLLEKLEILLLSITIIFVSSLFVFKKIWFKPIASNRFILKIGHRGACGYTAENSLGSFKKAIELGVDAVELDVRLCKSGEIIVIHDEKVNRTSNGSGYIKDLTLHEINSKLLKNDEKVPTLSQVFDLINRRTLVFIELKEFQTLDPVVRLIEKYVNKYGWSYNDVVIISFIKDAIFKVSKLNHNIKKGLLFNDYQKLVRFCNNINSRKNIEYIGVNYKILSRDILEKLHQKGFKVFVYTVNNINDVKEMKSMGVDGIVSDYPDKI